MDRAPWPRCAGSLPITNRDPGKLTTLIMTGVTAMGRKSAAAIEKSGDYGFLARQVGPELAAADLTIISNEIPFVEGCKVNTTRNNIILCSKPEYFENLALSGVDAVGLTGNHMNDFGHENDLASLALYAEKGIPVYAAGANAEAARKPAILEHNGNRLAFLGANQWGPESYINGLGQQVSEWAGPDTPGSARFDREQIAADIQAAKAKADLVFAEVQHTETNGAGDYVTEPIPLQEADFRAMSDAGAVVVTGVQAHAPPAVEFHDGRLILYGLGNLFFDQTFSWPTRTGLVAHHPFYDRKLINTELLVTVIQDDMQLRWATPRDGSVSRTVFDASGHRPRIVTTLRRFLTSEDENLLHAERANCSACAARWQTWTRAADDLALLDRALLQLDELFLLVIVGEFNAGKSAFINALLGQRFLAEGVTPTTTQINILKSGERPGQTLGRSVRYRQSHLPGRSLREINVVDTPGTNAIIQRHQQITEEFIPRADLVLFVTSADRPFSESERAFPRAYSRVGQEGRRGAQQN